MDDKDIHERVRARAHLLWEQEGRPEGMAEEHWRRAASLVEREEDAGPAPADPAMTESAGEDTGARRLRKTPASPRNTATAGKAATVGTTASASKAASAEPAKPTLVPPPTKSKRAPKPAP